MKNILTIDDDVIIVETISAQLASLGLQSTKAYNGKMGLEMAETQNPDLIILDLNMPEMSGFDVLKELKKKDETRDIPVILLTSNSNKADVINARKFNVIDYVLKPHSFKSLTKRFHIAAEIRKKTLLGRKPVSKYSVVVSRGGRKTTVAIRTELNEGTRREALKILGPTFRQLIKHDHFIVDLRSIKTLKNGDVFFLEKLLKDFNPDKLFIAAGENHDFLEKHTLTLHKERLFSSMGEVLSVIDRLNS